MIDLEELIVGSDPIYLFDNELAIYSRLNKGEKPADLVLIMQSSELVEKNFASLIFDSINQSMSPYVETLKWQSIFVIFGIRKCLIFQLNSIVLHFTDSRMRTAGFMK
jgi:hypothetical protein